MSKYPVDIGIGLITPAGGSVEGVRMFHNALNSKILSFTNAEDLDDANNKIEGIKHIPVTGSSLRRYFLYPTLDALKNVQNIISNASVINCHIPLRYHAVWVAKMAKYYKVPYIVIPHGCLDPYVFSYNKIIKYFWFKLFCKSFLKNASAVIFSTKREMEKAKHIYSGPNSRVMHWPVSPPKLVNHKKIRSRYRERLKIPQNARVVLYFGRINNIKNPLKTIELVAKSDKELHLIIAGPEDGVTKLDCLKAAKKYQMKNLHYLGPIFGIKKWELMMSADCYISLSKKENFNFCAAEALAVGLPVILSEGNDLRYDLKNVGCGWFPESNSESEIIKIIKEFNKLTKLQLNEMSINGKKWTSDKLTPCKFKSNLRKLL